MSLLRPIIFFGVVAISIGHSLEAQRAQQPPSIEFGGAKISLGMTVEQVEAALAENGRHIDLMSDKHTALVRVNDAQPASVNEGQVTFFDGRVRCAAFQFPETQNAVELAQEIAGAVENMDVTDCKVTNYSSHGTGGGFSQSIFYCGAKAFDVTTVETLGTEERYSNVEITIGAIPTPTR